MRSMTVLMLLFLLVASLPAQVVLAELIPMTFDPGYGPKPFEITPATPTTLDLVSVIAPLDGATKLSACWAATDGYDGFPYLDVNTPSRTINIVFLGPLPEWGCSDAAVDPVSGAISDPFGPLASGEWLLNNSHGGSLEFTVVPEPSTITMAAVLLALVDWRRRRPGVQKSEPGTFAVDASFPNNTRAKTKLDRPWFRSLAAFMVLFPLAMTSHAVTMENVPVGNPGNEPDAQVMNDGTSGYGSVDYAYRIGTYEVTARQYCEFLNAVADADTHVLYDPSMWDSDFGCKIRRTGEWGSYEYLVDADGDGVEDLDWVNRPVNYVSWGDAARASLMN